MSVGICNITLGNIYLSVFIRTLISEMSQQMISTIVEVCYFITLVLLWGPSSIFHVAKISIIRYTSSNDSAQWVKELHHNSKTSLFWGTLPNFVRGHSPGQPSCCDVSCDL